MKPITYLLCGLPGSGKTTWAKTQEENGVLRLTLDEELFKKFGRNFASGYKEKEEQTKEVLIEVWQRNILDGNTTILDFGFWKKQERDEYKQLAEEYGSDWKLIFFDIDQKELKARLNLRNKTNAHENHYIPEDMLNDFVHQFEVPDGEAEEIVSE